jgi:hypothetical protein
MKRGARQGGVCRKLPMPPEPDDDDSPGVPGFRTWRGVYLFVFGCFLLAVAALTLFSRHFT